MANIVPLHERRPDWLEERIDDFFLDLSSMDYVPPSYRFHGAPDYRYWDGSTALTEVRKKARANTDLPIRVLDIGTGNGSFVDNIYTHDEVEAFGLTAQDYRDFPEAISFRWLPEDHYVVGNAERLDDALPEGEVYDLIVSHWCIQHLIDPLGFLEQATDRLAPGGRLVIDGPRMHDPLPKHVIADAIGQSGLRYLPFPHNDLYANSFTKLVLERTGDEPLAFPLDYDEYYRYYRSGGPVLYKTSE